MGLTHQYSLKLSAITIVNRPPMSVTLNPKGCTMQKLNFYLTSQQYDKPLEMSKRTGLTMAELVRRAMDEFFSRMEDR